MNKKYVEEIKDCDTIDYRKLVKQIIGEKLVTKNKNITEGKLFKSPKDESKLVVHTKDYGCPSNTV